MTFIFLRLSINLNLNLKISAFVFQPLKNDKFVIPKSRFESISCYLSLGGREYSDLNPVYDKEIFQQLIDGGVDEQLALHYAHLWIRDPLTLWKEHIYEDDEKNSHHFEVCKEGGREISTFDGGRGWKILSVQEYFTHTKQCRYFSPSTNVRFPASYQH